MGASATSSNLMRKLAFDRATILALVGMYGTMTSSTGRLEYLTIFAVWVVCWPAAQGRPRQAG